MTRYSFFLLCALLGLLPLSAADPGKLRGTVRDASTGEPVAGAIVRARGAFATTSADGSFMLAPAAGADSISFRSIGYAPLSLPLAADLSDVRLTPQATLLNDVIVEAPDIYARGDTLVFNVARYANVGDNAIIDVIRRLPGIKVRDDGTIEYQGKPINRFYLDGNDLLGGRYGLATNNISARDVASVEVMERHQPVKALEGIEFPEEAGINLKLKDDARSRWAGVARAAAGVQPFLFAGSLFTMRMASKIQNMFTVKADNTGWNPASEITDHDIDMAFSSAYTSDLWPEYIAADIVDAPLSEKRTRDNLSCLADAITSWKTGDTSMRLRLDYMADRLDYNSGTTTDYFNHTIPTFVQNNAQRTRSHNLSARFSSRTNRRDYYLKDNLTLSGAWRTSGSTVTGSCDLSQHVTRENFSAVNDLSLIRRTDRRIFTLTSRNSFTRRPDRLIISGDGDAAQALATTDIRSTTETRVGRLTRFWKYYLTAGLDIDYHRMHAALSGLGAFDNDGHHSAFLSTLYAIPQADWSRRGWRISLSIPVKWQHYSIAGRHDYVNTSPGISLWRNLTARSELSASAAWHLASPQPYLYIAAPILSDYRNIFIAANPGRYTHRAAATLSYRYRNPLRSLFFNLSAAFSFRSSSIMSDQRFIDDLIISTFDRHLSRSRTWHLKGAISKGLGHSRMVVGFEADASLTSASSMRDSAVVPYRQTNTTLKPYFKGSILPWLSVNYEARYTLSRLAIDSESTTSHTLSHNLFATFIPHDRLQFTLGAEHFLTRFPAGNLANLVLLDASAIWHLSGKIRLSLTADNLLDRRRYRYITYGTLSRSVHRFNIRPRAILASLQLRF